MVSKWKVTVREVSIGEKLINKNIIVNGRTRGKVIDKFLWIWIKPCDIFQEKLRVRQDVFESGLENGAAMVVFKYETEEGKSLLRIEPVTLRKYSKKYEKRDENNARMMIPWMDIHLKWLKLVQGKPLWKEDPNQMSL